MPIPDAERARVSPAKVRDYLLNLAHPDGGTKAVWFNSIGYTRDHWHELAEDLLRIAHECADFSTEKTLFGLKYTAMGHIGRKNDRKRVVRTVWIQEDTEPPRLVTAYPDQAT